MRIAACFLYNQWYYRGVRVAIYSFVKYNKWFNGDIIIYTPDNIEEEQKLFLESLYKNVLIKQIDKTPYEEIMEIYKRRGDEYYNRLSQNSFYKFEVFSESGYDKVIFMDCDIVVIGDIKDIVYCDSKLLFSIDTQARIHNFTIKKREEEYINSGVFVIGKKYLNNETKKNLLDFAVNTDLSVVSNFNPLGGLCCDQDVFSLYFGKNMDICSNNYNCKFFFYDEKEDIKVIHFIGDNKPWIHGRRVNDEFWFNEENDMEKNMYSMRLGDKWIYFPKKDNSDKYIVCGCAKNENEYIEEWVKHHLDIGFDKILIFDNNDNPKILEDLLSQYIAGDVVEIFNCSGLEKFQVPMYDMMARSKNFKWMACFDVDEFLEISPKYNDVKEFLDNCEGDCVLVNWLMYGPDKQIAKRKGGVQERFRNPVYPISMFKENMFFKPIVKNTGKDFHFDSSHTPLYVNNDAKYNIGGYCLVDKMGQQVSYPVRYKKAWLKHYYTKSLEEYTEKMGRGWPDGNDVKRLTNFSHYLLMDSSDNINMIKFNENIFSKEERPEILNALQEYDVIAFTLPDKNYFALIYYVSCAMSMVSGYTFIVEEDIDENVFLILFELAIKTGNTLISNTDKDYSNWYIYLKHTKKEDKYNNSYYVITVL